MIVLIFTPKILPTGPMIFTWVSTSAKFGLCGTLVLKRSNVSDI